MWDIISLSKGCKRVSCTILATFPEVWKYIKIKTSKQVFPILNLSDSEP